MKRGFLGVSLLGNVVCAVILAKLYGRGMFDPAVKHPGPRELASRAPIAQAPIDDKIWERLQIFDNRVFLVRLRGEGFPPDLIRSIMSYRLQEQFHDRREALLARRGPFAYWKYQDYSQFHSETNGLDAKTRGDLRALDDEREKLENTLLGPEPEYPGEAESRKRQYGDLSADTVRKINAITRDYKELKSQVIANSQGILLASDREQLKFIDEQNQADLAATMSPAQWRDYCERAGPTAEELQMTLRNFDATEEEYHALYTLQTTFDEKYGTAGLSPAEQARRIAAKTSLLDQIKTVLGPDRYAQYQIGTDPTYDPNLRFVTRSEMAPEITGQLVSLQRDVAQKSAAIKGDATLSPEQQYANLVALSEEAEGRVESVLGSEATARYLNDAGNWLTKIKPAKAVSSK